jgi:hypothetical protein
MTMWHAHCMLYTKVYKQTLGICNTYEYFLSTATMVARTRFNVKSYVYCLSCYTKDNFTVYAYMNETTFYTHTKFT